MKVRMMKPIIIDREDTCPSCNCKRALEVYNSKDNPLRYSLILDQNKLDKLVDVRYLKCKVCGARYFPRWQTDRKVRCAEKMNINDFMSLYKDAYKH